jgi:NADH-quinone oxidoreductase subunit K
MTSLELLLLLSLGLFTLGVVGILVRRNSLFVLLSVELMLFGVNLALVTFSSAPASRANPDLGSVMALLVTAVTAIQSVLGIVLLLVISQRDGGSLNLDDSRELKG